MAATFDAHRPNAVVDERSTMDRGGINAQRVSAAVGTNLIEIICGNRRRQIPRAENHNSDW